MTKRVCALVLTLMLMVSGGSGVLAQDASPRAGASAASPEAGTDGVDLAAMTLDSSVMPEGYTYASERYINLDEMAEQYVGMGAVDSVEAFQTLNIVGHYESYYATEDSSDDIRSYVIEYETPATVQAGFDLLEDEGRTIPQEAGTWEDEPGLEGVGQEPSEVTTATFSGDNWPAGTNVDITFRVGRFHVGVAASAYGEGATIDRDQLEELAAALEERVTAVLAGEQIAGIDETLPSLVPPLDSPFHNEGYQTADDAFQEQVDAVDVDTFVSAYTRNASFAPEQLSPAPVLLLGVARFTDSQVTRDLLERADDLLPAQGEYERAEVDEVAGHPAAGYTGVSGFGGGEPDSFRVVVAADDLLLLVEVLGVVSVEEAEQRALGFAEDAVACATDGESCGPFALPADLAVPAATPQATPQA